MYTPHVRATLENLHNATQVLVQARDRYDITVHSTCLQAREQAAYRLGVWCLSSLAA